MEKRIRDRLDLLNFYQKQTEWKQRKEQQEREEEEKFRQEVWTLEYLTQSFEYL